MITTPQGEEPLAKNPGAVCIVRSYRASPIAGDADVGPLSVLFVDDLPEIVTTGRDFSEPAAREWYARAGGEVAEAMRRRIPGGLFDGILGAMLAMKASVFRVPHREPPVVEPAPAPAEPLFAQRFSRDYAAADERKKILAFLRDRAESYGEPEGLALIDAAEAISQGLHRPKLDSIV